MPPSPITVHHGDCLDVLRTLPDNSVDSVITDPPYGLADHSPAAVTQAVVAWASGDRERVPTGKNGFMGRAWDAFVPPPAVWDECLRVLKPGGHLLAFAGARTADLMGLSIRLAGFEIRDEIDSIGPRSSWIQGQGFPKSLNLPGGLGTALKPAHEPIIVARAPLGASGVAANVQQWGTGALNIGACRTETTDGLARPSIGRGLFTYDGFSTLEELEAAAARGDKTPNGRNAAATLARVDRLPTPPAEASVGRWPTNVVFSHQPAIDPATGDVVGDACESGCVDGCPVAELDAQSGRVGAHPVGKLARPYEYRQAGQVPSDQPFDYGDAGGASRFFPTFRYQAKAPSRERPKVNGIAHPTCKPVTLMRWLSKLVTPPGGVVLDPFAGSGTTAEACLLEGFRCITIEREADYLPLIAARLNRPVQPAIA